MKISFSYLYISCIFLKKIYLPYYVCVCQSLGCVRFFATPWTVAHQAPLSLGILQARRLEWVAYAFSRGMFPTQESNQGLLHCRRILYQLSYQLCLSCLVFSLYCLFLLPHHLSKAFKVYKQKRNKKSQSVI